MKKIFSFTCLLLSATIATLSQNIQAQTTQNKVADTIATPCYFSGRALTNAAAFTWKQADETHTLYYELQRSTCGSGFVPVLLMHAKGKSTYSYVDPNLPSGSYCYRLRVETRDGRDIYSQPVLLSLTTSGKRAKCMGTCDAANTMAQN